MMTSCFITCSLLAVTCKRFGNWGILSCFRIWPLSSPSQKQFNIMLLKQVHLKCIKLYQSRTSKQMLFHVKTRGRHHCVCLRNLQLQQYELSGFVLEEKCSSLPVSQFALSNRETMKVLGNNNSSTSVHVTTNSAWSDQQKPTGQKVVKIRF